MEKKGFKPQLENDLRNAINELFEAAQIPILIKKGFLFEINRILEQNIIKETNTPFKGDKK